MQVYLQTGSVTYYNATQAVEELRRRGFNVGEVTCERNAEVFREETLAKLLPWEVTHETRPRREKFQQQVRERLQEYHRKDKDAPEEESDSPK